ncbi:MAG: M48 family metalloprotease [Gammaproteobacteria bacterium]|nr:M48 family metalloprotease [Gammaproteobacteria bacterium]
MNPRILWLLLCVISFAGCASIHTPEPGSPLYEQSVKETQQAILETIEKQTLLRALTYPILSANADLCGAQRTYKLGFEWITLNDLGKVGRIQRDAGAAVGIGTYPYLTVVTPGSPVHQAGIRQGDTLVSLNESPISEDKERQFIPWLESGNDVVRGYRRNLDRWLHWTVLGGTAVSIEYKRGDGVHSIEVQPMKRCDFNIVIVDHKELSSRVVENTIFLSSTLFDFAESDAEIQFIIAHEMAHRIYRHRPGKLTPLRALALGVDALVNYGLVATQLVAGIVSGDELEGQVWAPGAIFSHQNNPPYRHALEKQADYLAMYMLARANIDVSDIDIFWERVPSDSYLSEIHVSKPGRIENMLAIQEELERKIESGSPLIPSNTRRVQADSAGSQEN